MPAFLTPEGQAKLERVMAAVQRQLAEEVALLATKGRAYAAEGAPGPEEEAATLSAGVAADGGVVGQVVGSPAEGRFLKEGGMVPLQQAIAEDPVEASTVAGIVVAETGRPSRINARSGFSWTTTRRGIQGPTLPFNEALVETWENGGAAWIVRARPDNPTGFLSPEPGLAIQQMIKTLYPRNMYGRAKLRLASDVETAGEAIRAAARAASVSE